jgi:hypothetical protein
VEVRFDGRLPGSVEVEGVLLLALDGLAYNVSRISDRLIWIWRFVILLMRPPQFSAGLPGQGWLQEPGVVVVTLEMELELAQKQSLALSTKDPSK